MIPNNKTRVKRIIRRKNGLRQQRRAAGQRGGLGSRIPSHPGNAVADPRIPGFAKYSYRTKITYYEVVSITTGVSAAGNYVFSANGCYDPNITGTGHQPMTFDQMMLSFDHYVVKNAVCTVTFRNSSTTLPLVVALSLNSGSTPITDYTRLAENGTIVRERMPQYPYTGSTATLKYAMNMAKFSGVPNVRDNPDLAGTAAANPAEQSYFHLSGWNPETADQVTFSGEVFIEYDVVFFEPRKNSSSLAASMMRLILEEEEKKAEPAAVETETLFVHLPAPKAPIRKGPVRR